MKTLLISLLLPLTLMASEPGKQIETSLKVSDEVSVPYLQYLPENFDTSKKGEKYPLILFLHGRGESKGPLSIVKKWGPPKLAEEKGLPYILISPQCPKESWWSNDDQQELLTKLLAHVRKEFPIDEKRIYLTGLSMGGFGSWEMAARHPKTFAAVVPICGGGDPENAKKLTEIPIWNWHGTADTAVPFSKSVEMVEAIKKAGGKKITFSVLEDVGHDSWIQAYGDPKLWEWMAQQKLK
ncbi:prolyl oligopeptidase family serine peptidase [Akkermansiaceae bacterium]|nr:prolyl oligopeptidase family serine peptidase [Akkermansiaceae bacterium]